MDDRARILLSALLASFALSSLFTAVAEGAFTDYGLASLEASRSSSQAGAHADLNVTFELKTDPASPADPTGLHEPYARTRNITVDLPLGFSGNPQAVPTCTNEQFSSFPGGSGCPQETQVGVTKLGLYGFFTRLTEPIFNLKASGNRVARLGYYASTTPNFININVDPERDYGVTATLEGISATEQVVRAKSELWAVPADSSHDTLRLTPFEAFPEGKQNSPPRPSGLEPVPFLANPTSCAVAPTIDLTVESYQLPGQVSSLSAALGNTTGCGLVPFDPRMSLRPTTTQAESPSGMDVHLSIDQAGMLEPTGTAPAHLKKAVVTLPEGMTLNPSAADGLDGCSTAEIGLIRKSPIRFDSSDPRCPSGAKVGTARVTTPVLKDPIEGALYVADQGDNPFDTLLSGYLVAQGQGVLIKLAGRFDTDPRTGRLTATFDNNPQQPFSDLELHFKGGSRGVLITPPACGSYPIESRLSPWSAADPGNPTAGEVATQISSFSIDSGPGGGPCPVGTLDPELQAGVRDALAGQFSPFSLRLTRKDGTQRFAAVDATLPPGLSAKLAGVPYCPELATAAAKARSGLGQGGLELTHPSCPAASEIGRVVAGAGAGPTPFYLQTGRIFLAGPYNGAPLSLIAVVPAVAGPFHLGAVVNRIALQVDPRTARVTARSERIPTILHGIPLDIRDIRVVSDRSKFVLNPTNCDEMQVRVGVTSEQGQRVGRSARFRVGGCRGLDFKPKLSLRLFGKTNRGAHPRLRAVLKARPGNANIGQASVALPRSEFLDQAHIGTICTRVQFAAEKCPKRSIYGHAKAITPLLDKPLSGPVYLRSSSNELPDLVMALDGQIDVHVVGRIDSVKGGGIRTTFGTVPDAPVSKLTLTMLGGSKGLLVNSRDLCRAPSFAAVKFDGQNGKTADQRPRVNNSCGNSATGRAAP